jgi:hypothetical protein
VVVLVSTKRIPAGTPTSVVLKTGRYELVTIRQDQVERGAFSDPSALPGDEVASVDIPPGSQLTASDFGSSTG